MEQTTLSISNVIGMLLDICNIISVDAQNTLSMPTDLNIKKLWPVEHCLCVMLNDPCIRVMCR